jgi:hypothetical protein
VEQRSVIKNIKNGFDSVGCFFRRDYADHIACDPSSAKGNKNTDANRGYWAFFGRGVGQRVKEGGRNGYEKIVQDYIVIRDSGFRLFQYI